MSPSGPKPNEISKYLLLHYWIVEVNGLSYKQFADMCGSSRANVSNHASGRIWPKPETLKLYAHVLQMDWRDLMVPTIEGLDLKYPPPLKRVKGKARSIADAPFVSNTDSEGES